MKFLFHDGLLARQRISKLISALAALRHCHPKYELFSPWALRSERGAMSYEL